jgi:hypothetical protein
MTQLDAYNYILSQVGAAPVDSLDNILPDLASAILRLNESMTWVQKAGWWFNEMINVEMVPVPDEGFTKGHILLPANTMKIRADYPTFLIAKNGEVYDPINDSFVFESAICVDITLLQIWDDLPMSVQDAVMYRAAATMVQHELEDMNKSNTIMQEFQQAYVLMKAEDLEIKQRHSFGTPAVQRMMRRVRPYKRASSGTTNPAFPGGRGY